MDSQRDAPIYNIKAVSHLTGMPADTLRRWESRYNVITPQRTESGYRLYSQRDVDTILWLKTRLEEGMSISRACELLRTVGGDPAHTAGNGAAASVSTPTQPHFAATVNPASQAPDLLNEVRSPEVLREELLNAFRDVDEIRAGEVLNEALGLYSLEDVCLNMLQPVLVKVGELWLNGQISVAVEHFAASFVRSRLANLFHSSPHSLYGPLVLVGCAPGEFHELGAMVLALFLRRSGYRVVYLGQNVPLDSLESMIESMNADAVCISATRAETASALYSLRDFLDALEKKTGSAPLLSYGGQVFNKFPHITERLGGIYLGEDARAAVRTLSERLRREG
ncbi:MAG: B12-binding domain-containing protein [Chloroflexota bacterium]